MRRGAAATKSTDAQTVMEYLLAHADDASLDAPLPPAGAEAAAPTLGTAAEAAATEEAPQARSFKCLECGKLLRDMGQVQLHCARTQHSQIEESTEEKAALTPEEVQAPPPRATGVTAA